MENSVATDYEKIFIEKPIVHNVEALKDGLERLDKVKNTLDKKRNYRHLKRYGSDI